MRRIHLQKGFREFSMAIVQPHGSAGIEQGDCLHHVANGRIVTASVGHTQMTCQRRILFRKFAAQIMQGGQFALVVWQQSLHFQELQGNTAIESCVLEF
jgi:hypothetical protein